ncbi:MAG: pilus assembly protein TadG-related protein, partial [Pseudomonadota bacterium]
MNAFLKDTITLYRNDERGVVAILFALMLVGVLLVVGLAIDVGRATRATSRLDAALDAAALAGAKGIRLQGLSAAETRLVAERVFRENLASQTDSPLVVNDLAVAVDLNKSRVQVSTNSEIPMTLGQLAGIDKM